MRALVLLALTALAIAFGAVDAAAGPPAAAAASPKLYLKVAGYRASVDVLPPGTLLNDCSAYCTFAFPPGTPQVTLTAQPGLGSSFVGWMQAFSNLPAACSGNFRVCTINLASSRAVKAAFSPVSLSWYELNGNGVVDFLDPGAPCGPECRLYPYNAVADVHARADDGYAFASWYGTTCSGEFCGLRMNANRIVSAGFRCTGEVCQISEPISHPTTVNVQVSGSGRVTGPGIDCPGVSCTHEFRTGSTVSLAAIGASFKGWSLRGVRCSARRSRCTFTASHTATISPTLIAYFGA
ncbi:MAG TPA: hypothetical protein VF066_18280 [Thermoleophilaceae bacterium]